MTTEMEPMVLIILYAMSQPELLSVLDLADIVSPNPSGPMVARAQINRTISKMMIVPLDA